MEVTATENSENESLWGGAKKPFEATYGKMMMWFFIVSDALTFSGFLVSYAFSRFKNIDPANTLVQAKLVGEEYKVEIEAEAILD